MDEHDGTVREEGAVGTAAVKWGAIVIIVLAILYFLARFVMPLFG